ncbi:tonB-system energizer ExbB [Bradyrhizobium ontarionense]|uniref:Biopolymer transport protein ExbB n=1 Tax=Bradyrhizobium ontarionense TaxID=2898149 RepID=A0ABY3R6X8_9BRAD|nr:tonB-system energizer ExbB [Bradyrhizobium sp. A19]UFZ02699.1 tonB-system energizer ExbB [Bradyrhizobium sp. A19]
MTGELAQDATRAPSASPLPPQQPAHGSEATPAELSPLGMFLGADIVVKSVMIGLVLASVLTWTVWLYKIVELHLAKRNVRAGLRVLTSAPTLAAAASELGLHRNIAAKFVAAAQREAELSAGVSEHGVRDRLSWQLERVEAAASRRIASGMGLLATIGAVAPFVGLFGTVWGIMNSFIGISRLHTTNLAVVAPGIAEALLSTAAGLVAAIPAVVIYNAFTRAIGSYRATLRDASVAVLCLTDRIPVHSPPTWIAAEAPTQPITEAAE